MSDHGDTGMWVGFWSAVSAAFLLIVKEGPKVVRLLLKVMAMKRDEAVTVPQIPQCQPSGHRPTSAATIRAVENTAVANERLEKLSDAIEELGHEVREARRETKALRGDMITALDAMRTQQDRTTKSIDRNAETNEALTVMLGRIADALKQRKL